MNLIIAEFNTYNIDHTASMV